MNERIVNFYDRRAENITKTVILFAGFTVFMVVAGYVIGTVYAETTFLVPIAFLFSLVSAFISYYFSDRIVLSISRAKPATKEEYFDYYTVVENISIGTGMPMPKLYVIDDPAPNAFATGRNPQNAAIAATTGLLRTLDRSELEGVMAHEMAHVGNRDILLMTVTAVMVGTIVLVMDWFWRIRFFGGGGRNKNAGGVFVAIAILTAILAPIVAQIIKLAISRQREFLADATAVKYTRNPNGLVNSLTKIASFPGGVKAASKATAHLYFNNPLKGAAIGTESWFSKLFSTHPPVAERINRLKMM